MFIIVKTYHSHIDVINGNMNCVIFPTAVGDLQKAAILYFACAVVVLFLCVVTLFTFVKMVRLC